MGPQVRELLEEHLRRLQQRREDHDHQISRLHQELAETIVRRTKIDSGLQEVCDALGLHYAVPSDGFAVRSSE